MHTYESKFAIGEMVYSKYYNTTTEITGITFNAGGIILYEVSEGLHIHSFKELSKSKQLVKICFRKEEIINTLKLIRLGNIEKEVLNFLYTEGEIGELIERKSDGRLVVLVNGEKYYYEPEDVMKVFHEIGMENKR